MPKILIKQIEEYVELYKDSKTGIAWVENGKAGIWHSCHPNIDKSGSIRGMKKIGYWKKSDKCIQSQGCIYNISKCVVTDDFDKIAMEHCKCGGNHQIIIYPNGSKYWYKDKSPITEKEEPKKWEHIRKGPCKIKTNGWEAE